MSAHRLERTIAPLREQPFRRRFLAESASVLGDNIAGIAITFAVLDLTGSATDLGLVFAARTVSLAVFVLVGGAIADRFPRQRLMVASDLGRFATQSAVAALLLTGTARVWELVVLQALNGAATAVFQPASSGLTPETVTPRLLQQANALLSTAVSVAAAVGPAIGGVLVAAATPGWALVVDALSFLVSAYFLRGLTVPPRAIAPEQSLLQQLAGGWREVRTRSWVWVSIVNFMLFQLLVLGTFQIAGPLIANESLGGPAAWAAIVAAIGVGSLLGNGIALVFEPRRPLVFAFRIGFLFLPALALLAARAPIAAIVAAAAIYGIAWSLPDTMWFTALQEHIPRSAISRVSAYDWLGSIVLRPLGYAAAGPVIAAVGAGKTLGAAAAVFALVNAATLLTPSIARLERTHGSREDGEPGVRRVTRAPAAGKLAHVDEVER
jgi:predicted MFS family arabinose efflux permease